MKDAGSALATAYTTLLANLTYDGQLVKVYSGMAPDEAVTPYVILGPWQPVSDNTKYAFGQKGEINLDVVTRFTGNVFSKKPANEIANSITNLIKPTVTAEALNVTGFKTYNTVIVDTQELTAPTSTDRMYRKIISISHSLQQL